MAAFPELGAGEVAAGVLLAVVLAADLWLELPQPAGDAASKLASMIHSPLRTAVMLTSARPQVNRGRTGAALRA